MTMAIKQKNQHQVSVKGETRDRLRDYCRRHGVQMRSVIDDIINRALDAEEKRS